MGPVLSQPYDIGTLYKVSRLANPSAPYTGVKTPKIGKRRLRNLRSRRPFAGVLFGESPKVLRRVFWGFPESAAESARKIGSAPGSAPRSAFRWERNVGSTSWGTPYLPGTLGHSRGHFLGIPKKHSESTRRSTFGDSPKSTPVNGRWDCKLRSRKTPCPPTPEKGISSQKGPISIQSNTGKMGILGDFDPCAQRTLPY